MVVTFCGHADFSEHQRCRSILLSLLEQKIGEQPTDFYLGGYGGFDEFALRCCNIFKKSRKDIKIIYITPYLGENNTKLLFAKKYYDEVIYPEIENVPLRLAIIKRNEWMVRKADCIITFVNRRFGGAYNAIKYADKMGKQYFNLYNNKFEI